MVFKTAARTPDELIASKKALNEAFDIVKGSRKGEMNRKALQKLEENKFELAELILQVVNDTVLSTDPTPFLVDQVEGDLGNNYVWQELDSTLRVVSRSYGTKPLSQRLTFKEYGMTTSHKEIAVTIPLEQIAVGRITPSQVTDAMAEAINRYRITTILDGIDAAVTAVADHTGLGGYVLRYVSLSQANLDKAINGLLDESASPTIFGRHIALAPAIQGFTGFSDETKRELEVRGMIGTYRGAPVVSLRDQFHKREGGHLIRKDRVWLTSGTKGARFMTKDVSFLDYSVVDPRSSTFEVGTRLEDGLLVHDAQQYRIIEV